MALLKLAPTEAIVIHDTNRSVALGTSVTVRSVSISTFDL